MKKITFLLLMLFASFAVSAQCINSTAYLTVTSNNNNVSQQIATCTFSTEYNTINGIVVGEDYEFVATDAGADVFVTITDLSNNVIASGPSPLTVSAITSSEVRLHVTADETCAGGSVCHVTSFRSTSITCLPPTALTASNITTSGADLGWTENNTATSWNVEIVDVTAGGTQTMTATASGVTNPYTASGLTDANDYEFYVQADCGGGDLSPWAGPFGFTTVANCVDPSGLTISTVTTVSAEASWTENGTASVYNVELVNITAGGTQTMTATEAGVGNPHTFTGLSPNVDYEYYVLADCGATGGSGVSQWVGPFSFTTPCTAQAAPYTETFETFTVSAADFTGENCWSATVAAGGYNWEVAATTDTSSTGTGPGSGVSDGNYLFTEATTATAGSSVDLISPLVDLSTLTAPALFFDYHMFGVNMGTLEVLVNGTDSVFTISGQQQLENDPFLTGVVDLATYAGQTISVTFRATMGASFESDLALDTISFDEAPACIAPAGNGTVVLDCATSMFSIDVDVTSLGDATSINIFDGTTSTPVNATGVTTVGPYAFGSTIDITLVHDTDNSCDTDLGSFTDFACPPANDECDNAIGLTVNEDLNCGEVTAGTTVAATASPQPDDATGTPNNDVWFTFTATNTAHLISLLNVTAVNGTATDMGMSVFDDLAGCSMTAANEVGESDPNSFTVSGLTAGNTYYLRVYGWSSSPTATAQTNFDVCVGTPPPPPANDDCAGALVLTESADATCSNAVSGTTVSATASAEADCSTTNSDVWYTFVPTTTANYTLSVTETMDFGTSSTYVSIFEGSCGALTQVGTTCTSTSVSEDLVSGTTYYVSVRSTSTTAGVNFDLCAYPTPPPPANDLCTGSEPISCGETLNGTTIQATGAGGATSCDGSIGNDVWYQFTGTGDNVTITVVAANEGSQIGVYESTDGTCAGFTEGACVASEDGLGTLTTSVDFASTAGTEYYISVGAWISSGDDFLFTIEAACTPPNDECADAEALTLGVMVTGDSTNATDSGIAAATCGPTGGDQDIWYSFVATTTGAVTVDTTADTAAIYDACGGTEVACVGEGMTDVGGLTDGTTYYVRVYNTGVAKVAGPIELTISEATLSTTDFDGNTIFSYYPNPVNNTLTLNAQQAINNVSVFNMLGQEVIRIAPNAVSNDVDMSKLQSGAYFVQVTVGSAVETVRIIKN
ncbi:fibronectin type III domain-containing protein [Lacinutrix chionoecetis]